MIQMKSRRNHVLMAEGRWLFNVLVGALSWSLVSELVQADRHPHVMGRGGSVVAISE